MNKGFRARLCQALVAKGLINNEQLASVLKEAESTAKNPTEVLIDRKLITQEKLFAVLAEELNMPMMSLAKYRLDPQVTQLIPERVARQYALIPISKLGERLVVAMADPMNVVALDDLKALTEYAIDPVLAQEAEIRKAIEQAYAGSRSSDNVATIGSGESAADAGNGVAGEEDLDSAVRMILTEGKAEAPVVQVVNMLVKEALVKRASDIHLEPMSNCLRVRYRIDGHLKETHRLPKGTQNAVLSRLKILSGLDIAEWRLPQDGRFKVRVREQEVDFRVSVLPITQGGKVVMRVLDKSNLSIGLDQLGFFPESIELFKETVKRPYGMILVTGPTGSGKSTTLYSILNQLNHPSRNIITIEDPVEYQVEGITQVQVNADIGLTFASGLRALLRQSPDVVMLGEIRDFETADIALKASLTGQLVLSTLHTNDAPSAPTRLIDMGVEPFLVASSVTLVEAQRLVRKIYIKCRKPYHPAPDLLERLKFVNLADTSAESQATQKLIGDEPPTFYEAVGCHLCNGSGYKGRIGIIELVAVDERIRELIVAKSPSWEIKNYAIAEKGMSTLRQDGLKKVAAGLTTLEEIVRVTSDE